MVCVHFMSNIYEGSSSLNQVTFVVTTFSFLDPQSSVENSYVIARSLDQRTSPVLPVFIVYHFLKILFSLGISAACLFPVSFVRS